MRALISIACTVAVIGVTTPVSAQGKGGSKVKTNPGTTTMHGSSATHGKSATYKPAAAPKTTTTTTKSGHGGGHTKTATDAKATGRAKATTTTATTTTTTTTTKTTTAATGTTLTPVQQKLQRNTNLASKLQSRLPAGTDLNTAAAGFRNLGQFVAAVNVSNNLGLDFPTLKTAMVTDGKSLGQAIQAQKGTSVEAHDQAVRAEHDADTMIRSTEHKDRINRHGKQQ
jgi:hypothetical protein